MSINWAEVWEFVWPILKQGLIALLVSVLGLMGYDRVVPSRYARRSGDALTPEGAVYARHKAAGATESRKLFEGWKVGKPFVPRRGEGLVQADPVPGRRPGPVGANGRLALPRRDGPQTGKV